MKTHESFSDWYADQSRSNKRIITRLRSLVFQISPKLVESCKWTNGVWLKGELPIIFIHTESDHLQFGFFAGATFSDPKKILHGKGKFVRHIRLENIEDINEAALSTMIRKAIKAPSYR